MKAFGCILISALAIYTLVPTSGYDVQPLYGRTFNLFNLLTSPQALLSRLTSLTARFTILQSTVDVLSSQFTALRSLVTSLQAQITALQNSIPKCPSTVSDGKVYDGKCYTVTTVAAGITYANAQAACVTPGGGSLAEPSPIAAASQLFYTGLQSKFSTQFASVQTTAPNRIWIGYKTQTPTATSVTAQIAGTSVDYGTIPSTNIIINPTVATTTGFAAAIKAPFGNQWEVVDLVSAVGVAATPKAYICQYNLV